MAAVGCPDDAHAVVRAAFDVAAGWLGRTSEPDPGAFTPVFGQGDGNLANFLWDGHRARLVDFEDSGRSDRAFELATFVEHVLKLLGAGDDRPSTVRERAVRLLSLLDQSEQ